jgi:predicted ATPase
MFHSIQIRNFKSLVEFDMHDLSNLVCVVGLNGSGKTSLLQFFDFLSQLVRGGMKDWLAHREWKSSHLVSHHSNKKSIAFVVEFSIKGERFLWSGSYNTTEKQNRCTQEAVFRVFDGSADRQLLLRVEEGKVTITKQSGDLLNFPINFEYTGSILSSLKILDDYPQELIKIKEYIASLKALDLLAPHLIRKRAKTAEDVGYGGEKLSAFLFHMDKAKVRTIEQQYKKLFPSVENINVASLKAGWKEIQIREQFETPVRRIATTDAHHTSDGMLRLLTILALAQTDHGVILLDEIENGINPELVGRIVDFVLEESRNRQIFITTHSPLVLNYLPDEIARSSIFMLYKNSAGQSQACRFFDIEAAAEKLRYIGPGEVFAELAETAQHGGA